MTLKEAYCEGRKILKNARIEEEALDAWYLLEYVTGISKSQYYISPEREIKEDSYSPYMELIKKRAAHIPLQHLTGTQEFMGLEFEVNPHVLIPRQDTEVLVEIAETMVKPDMRILDMCTGSGCIAISLGRYAKEHHIPIQECTGCDISKKALETAKKNARKNQTDISFVESDLFDHVKGKYHMIVSNPPYIKTAVIERLQDEVKLHDPYIALDGKEDGLYFYRRMIEQSIDYLETKGHLLFEIGYDQAEKVKEMMEQAGYEDITVKKDLAGLDRVVCGVYNR